jgi:hypothetical protein
MSSVAQLKSAFLKAMTKPIKARGYEAKRRDMFLTATDFGNVGVRFKEIKGERNQRGQVSFPKRNLTPLCVLRFRNET